jgi:gamma-glutamyl:cysteine ligase YbdK (ATP-grasp superfamily)
VWKPADSSSLAPDRPLRLFEAVGIELEYMIVHNGTLDVHPSADQLLEAVAGELTDEFLNGEIAWNNELALHVIELKCNGPRRSLAGLAAAFAANVELASGELADVDRLLMPGAMHPWMDPRKELELWPHGLSDVYAAFDRIFSCKGHGWANLQSTHVNLPFADDEEFARLHAAIRFLLPILPGLAASSPIIDGARNGVLDNRLAVYRTNCAKIPSISGDIVPEPIGSMGEYREMLLGRLYRDLEPHDPERVLQHEWVNARGAIARFERMAIEIRVLDVQETPHMDVAYAALIIEVLKLLCTEEWASLRSLQAWRTPDLGILLRLTERQGETAGINDRSFLRAFGYRGSSATVGELWEHLIEAVSARGALELDTGRMLEHYLRYGTLATRIAAATGLFPDRAKLKGVYGQLCESLATSTPFKPPRADSR